MLIHLNFYLRFSGFYRKQRMCNNISSLSKLFSVSFFASSAWHQFSSVNDLFVSELQILVLVKWKFPRFWQSWGYWPLGLVNMLSRPDQSCQPFGRLVQQSNIWILSVVHAAPLSCAWVQLSAQLYFIFTRFLTHDNKQRIAKISGMGKPSSFRADTFVKIT